MDIEGTQALVGHAYHEKEQRPKEIVFAKTEELTVSLYGGLPVEVRQVLRSAGVHVVSCKCRHGFPDPDALRARTDFFAESYVGGIDNASGYALVMSARTCYVWLHATLKPSSPSPTCYILPCPPPSTLYPNATFQAPHHALVPSRSRTVESGLILVSPTGTVRFWSSISSGLSGGGTFESAQVPLEASHEEYVSCFTRIDQPGAASTHTYLAATSAGRIFRLVITSQSGRPILTIRPFAPPPTSSSLSFTRMLGIGWGASMPRPEPGNVVTLVSSGNELFALVETRIQRWGLTGEELKGETDVGGVIRQAIGGGIGVEDLEGIDLAVERCVR